MTPNAATYRLKPLVRLLRSNVRYAEEHSYFLCAALSEAEAREVARIGRDGGLEPHGRTDAELTLVRRALLDTTAGRLARMVEPQAADALRELLGERPLDAPVIPFPPRRGA